MSLSFLLILPFLATDFMRMSVVDMPFRLGGVAVLVLDSGAFITGAKLDRFGPDVKYVTVPSVITEIRDEKTRHNLASFPFPIEQRSVSPEAMAAVSRFARKTGDLAALSGPDLQIIALTYMFETEQHGQVYILS